jgi:hypothetical protein
MKRSGRPGADAGPYDHPRPLMLPGEWRFRE